MSQLDKSKHVVEKKCAKLHVANSKNIHNPLRIFISGHIAALIFTFWGMYFKWTNTKWCMAVKGEKKMSEKCGMH